MSNTIITWLKVLEIFGASKIADIQEKLEADEDKNISPIGFYMPVGEEE